MNRINCYLIKKNILILLFASMIVGISGCGEKNASAEPVEVDVTKATSMSNRSNEPNCLVPLAEGKDTIGNELISIDISNAKEGYFYISYYGENQDVKMQMACEDDITYTYKLASSDTVVPLSEGDGTYQVIVYEGMGNGQYSVIFAGSTDVTIENEFGPYLYPNYYCDFNDSSQAIEIGQELAKTCTCDLEVIGAVYDYVIGNIEYDHDEAENVASDYVPDVDEILETKKGICFDYASLMAAMLRSQRIPTKLEIGYAGDAYHAWVTTYVEDVGWINGIIQFDGTEWTLMDPTFAANADTKTLKKFVGDGSNYTIKYEY